MPPPGTPSVFWTLLGFSVALGASLGSFLNVVVYRWPRELSLVQPPSHCPSCNTPVAWYDNIPIVSWILLRGRCRHCEARISAAYPLVEALTALLSGALAWKLLAFQIHSPSFVTLDIAALALPFVAHLSIVLLLLAAALIDLRHYLVPHVLTVPAMVIGLATPWLQQTLFSRHAIGSWWPPVTPYSSLLGFIGGAVIVIGIFGIYWAIRQTEGMGGGDATLMAVVGAWLGWPALVFVLFASSLQGSLVAGISWLLDGDWLRPSAEIIQETSSEKLDADDRGSERLALPFGPFIVLAALEHFFLGDLLPMVLSMSYLYSLWGF